jgi:hypothetical protein
MYIPHRRAEQTDRIIVVQRLHIDREEGTELTGTKVLLHALGYIDKKRSVQSIGD